MRRLTNFWPRNSGIAFNLNFGGDKKSYENVGRSRPVALSNALPVQQNIGRKKGRRAVALLWWQEQPKKRQKGLKIPPLLSQLRLSCRGDFLLTLYLWENRCWCAFAVRVVHVAVCLARGLRSISASAQDANRRRFCGAENKWEKSVNFAHCWSAVRLI
jgi:hypothetical protein